ncbi:MAG: hypothetical protein Q7K39_00695 [Candidatus Magasanikbacteria bacterium]|nr:hypothetical protein [Candidatus Magasanikbacteria bacterium]
MLHTLSVVELLNSFNSISKKKIYKNQYVAIKGFMHGEYLFNSEKDWQEKTENYIRFSHRVRGGILRKLFKKKLLDDMSGDVVIIGKIIRYTYTEIDHVVAGKLLNKSGEEINFVQLEKENMPLMLRDKNLFDFGLIGVEEFIKHYDKYKRCYVYLEGYYENYLIYPTEKKKEVGGVSVDRDIHFHSSIDYFLKKMATQSYTGRIRIVGKAGVAMTNVKNIGQILKVELVDDKGNIINSAKINENSIPKELRHII